MPHGWVIGDDIKKKFYKILFLISVLICMLLFSKGCEQKKINNNLISNISQLNFKNQKFKTQLTKTGDSINIQNQIILTQKQAIDNGLIEIERLKKIKSRVSVITKTKIDTLFIPYDKIIKDTIYENEIYSFKKFFNYKDPKDWFSLNGYVTDKGIGLDNIYVKNDYTIYIADTKLGLFKKSVPSVLLVNRNPNTQTISMNNLVIKNYKPFYKENWFWGGVGLIGGFIIAK